MITSDPNSALGIVCRIVSDLRPGECCKFDRYDPLLRDIPEYEHNGARFRAPDRVLGNIVGSRYTHSWREDWLDGGVIFERHDETGAVRYEDPDRRGNRGRPLG
jgi:hypothetical protein